MRVIPKNAHDSIRVQMTEFQGSRYLDVRTWTVGDDGQVKPTRKGVTIPLAAISAFAGAVADVAMEARHGQT